MNPIAAIRDVLILAAVVVVPSMDGTVYVVVVENDEVAAPPFCVTELVLDDVEVDAVANNALETAVKKVSHVVI